MSSTKVSLVSIVIPVYNEEKNIAELLRNVLEVAAKLTERYQLDVEIIAVDDGSTDGTKSILKDFEGRVTIVTRQNGGKGCALRDGFKIAIGEIVCIQDADQEYDPHNFLLLIQPILNGHVDVVYGSRYLNSEAHKGSLHRFNNGILNRLLWAMTRFRLKLTDFETCQKVFLAKYVHDTLLRSHSFTIEVELTIAFFLAGARFLELPIEYNRRDEGKKLISWKDGPKAIFKIFQYGSRAFFS